MVSRASKVEEKDGSCANSCIMLGDFNRRMVSCRTGKPEAFLKIGESAARE
jgi:hypothetical protein